jgi:hypothetical protein
MGARHNAAAAVFPILALVLFRARLYIGRARWVRLAMSLCAGLALTVFLRAAMGRALSPISQREEFWQIVPTFDLAGMSLAADRVLVDPSSGVLTPGMGVSEIRRLYSPEYCNMLYYCVPLVDGGCVPLFRKTKDPARLEALTANWLDAVRQHPLAYAVHRGNVALALLGMRGGPRQIYYLAGVPHHPLAAEYPSRRRTLKFLGWIDAHLLWLPFRPWLYVGACLVLFPIALVRYLRGGPVVPVLCALSGLSYVAGTILSAGSSDYRYMVWAILCTLLSAIALSARAPRLV